MMRSMVSLSSAVFEPDVSDVRAPAMIETDRLLLRRPLPSDAAAVFERYAADPAVTRFLGWPTHRSMSDTQTFLGSCEAEWERCRVGPYLIQSRHDGRVLGSTGVRYAAPRQAVTGYVLARDAWGQGYATEALRAMRDLALRLGLHRLYAVCHPDHRASWRVMEKCGFTREAILHAQAVFPNIAPGVRSDVLCYSFSAILESQLDPPSFGSFRDRML
jgi:RimJ/RimL family protein N-acetyltransferase